jgi:hypothetical protein
MGRRAGGHNSYRCADLKAQRSKRNKRYYEKTKTMREKERRSKRNKRYYEQINCGMSPLPPQVLSEDVVTDKAKKVRGWVFTVNNFTDVDAAKLSEIGRHARTKYMVFAEEVAPSTGTRHLQEYILYRSSKVCTSVLKDLKCTSSSYPFLKCAKATPFKNRQDCLKLRPKDDDEPNTKYYEFGEIPKGGNLHF